MNIWVTFPPRNWQTRVTCAAAVVACFFWSFIHDLKSVQVLHGFFFSPPLCSRSLPELSSGGLSATANGKPSNPGGLEADGPLGPVGAAMFALCII